MAKKTKATSKADKKREQKKYRIAIHFGSFQPAIRSGKTQGSFKQWLHTWHDHPRFEKAIIEKRQEDGSWKEVEIITKEDLQIEIALSKA